MTTDFTRTKAAFHLPAGVIYLDGNSLGPRPKHVTEAVSRRIEDEWGDMLITAWNRAGWMAEPVAMADRIGMDHKWIQKPGTIHEHFDIPVHRRRMAVLFGAVEITMAQAGRIVHARRRARGG